MSSVVLVFLAAACGHGARQAREDEACNSATARVPVLIAKGEYAQAQVLITELLKTGLVTQVQAEHWHRQMEEKRMAPERRPPPVSPWVPESGDPPEEEARSCRTQYPEHPLCLALPEDYRFASPHAALQSLKVTLGSKSLSLHNTKGAKEGPCPDTGTHYNVRGKGERMGSITCCQCCVNRVDGPVEREKCRIVW